MNTTSPSALIAGMAAISYYLPPTRLTNGELSQEFPEWSVDKIAAKTGILERRIAGAGVCASDLAYESARILFNEHGVSPGEIDFLLLCTQSPDYFLPTTACLLQDRLGIPTTAGAFDFNLGCSGFVYGLSIARSLIASGDAKNVLLLTAETYSKFIHPQDKSVRTLFGDAAAATLVKAGGTGAIGSFVFGTDGRGGGNLIVKRGACRYPPGAGVKSERLDEYGNKHSDDCLYMNGTEIFNFTLEKVPVLVREVLRRANWTVDDVDMFVFHQANNYMMEALRKSLKIPAEKFLVYLQDCGNTVSSTIPIALAEAIKGKKVRAGDKLVLVGFGVGYSWAGCSATL
jgi:3-oxoacyl-[acyl-carrier-protein] synthase-3